MQLVLRPRRLPARAEPPGIHLPVTSRGSALPTSRDPDYCRVSVTGSFWKPDPFTVPVIELAA